MPAFSFLTATEILFGRGQAAEAAPRAAALGRRVALLAGR
ncbi:alcohol dehydrogenase, partial [Cereibacter changlensis]